MKAIWFNRNNGEIVNVDCEDSDIEITSGQMIKIGDALFPQSKVFYKFTGRKPSLSDIKTVAKSVAELRGKASEEPATLSMRGDNVREDAVDDTDYYLEAEKAADAVLASLDELVDEGKLEKVTFEDLVKK